MDRWPAILPPGMTAPQSVQRRGVDLLDFLRSTMSMTANYQPAIIAELIRHGGRAPRRQLAEALVRADALAMARADRVLMRWPRRTLRKHGLVTYHRTRRDFTLDVTFRDDAERAQALALATRAVETWVSATQVRRASRRYRSLVRSRGRCEACGAPAAAVELDVDHIIPRSRSDPRTRKISPRPGHWIDVDDPENLQVLCATCNRGKRDTDDHDFRPSLDMLAQNIASIRRIATELSFDPDELERRSRLPGAFSNSAALNRDGYHGPAHASAAGEYVEGTPGTQESSSSSSRW